MLLLPYPFWHIQHDITHRVTYIYLTWYQSQTLFLASNKHLYTSKKIQTCIPPSEVTHISLLDLDSMTSCSHHGSVLCQNPTNLSKPVTSILDPCTSSLRLSKSTHRRAPRPPVRKTQKSGLLKPCHAPPRASVVFGKYPRAASDSDFRSCSWYTRRHDGLLVHRSTEPEILGLNRAHTRLHAPP